MEAMACGAVPISSDIGGTRDYCLHGHNGLRFPVGCTKAAVARILEIGRDPRRWKQYRKRSTAIIRDMGSTKDNVRSLLDLFASAIRTRTQGRPGLFTFDAFYRTTVTTLEGYVRQADLYIEQGETDLARDLAEGTDRTLTHYAANDPGLLIRHGHLFAEIQLLLHRLDLPADLLKAARYSGKPEALRQCAPGSDQMELCVSAGTPDARLHLYLQSTTQIPERDFTLWHTAINREGRHILLTGDDPLTWAALPELINGIAGHIMIHIRTELPECAASVATRLHREVHFLAVWREERSDRAAFLERLALLLKNRLLAVTIQGEIGPEGGKRLTQDLFFFHDKGISVSRPEMKQPAMLPSECLQALCRTPRYLVGPDGFRYQCISRLVRRDQPLENFLTASLDPAPCISSCTDCGTCTAEDLCCRTALLLKKSPKSAGKTS
jgi:hypothetical protein